MKHLYIILTLIGIQSSFSQPANDDCSNAEAISVTTNLSTINFDINTATINTEEGCPGTTFDYADVWYNFTMPVSGNLFIDGFLIWNNFEIYDSCNGTILACGNSELFVTDISANTNLVLRVFRSVAYYTLTQYQSFDIQAFETPINDNCNTSQNIPLNTLQETVPFNILGSTIDTNSGCSNAAVDYTDVWYDFTLPFDGNVIIDGGILWNKFEIFDTCNGTSIACGEDELSILGLTSGTNYKIRVYRNITDAFRPSFLSFTIQAFEAATNDNCDMAETISVLDNVTVIGFNIGGSTIDNTTGCTSDIAEYADVWFQFTLDEDSDVDINSIIAWNKFELYNDCNSSSLQCFEEDGTFSALTAGTYYLRVFRDVANASNSSFVNFSISKSTILGINEAIHSETRVYPNPAKGKLTVSTIKPISGLEIYNMLGQKVSQNSHENTIDVSELKHGIYILKISIDKLAITKRILVE